MRDDMNPTLNIWLSDAEELDLDLVEQKGMLFCMGFMDTHDANDLGREEALGAIERMCPGFADSDLEIGGNFYDAPIKAVLTELLFKAMPGHSSREISGIPGVEPHRVFNPEDATNCLPDISLQNQTWSQGHNVAIGLVGEIGKHIDEEVGVAYASGILMAQSYAAMDPQSTHVIAMAIETFLPPPLKWLSLLHTYTKDEQSMGLVRQDTLRHKIFHAAVMLCADRYPSTTKLASALYDVVNHPDNWRDSEGEPIDLYNIPAVNFLSSLTALRIKEIFADMISDADQANLLEDGFESPPDTESLQEAVQWLASDIHGHTGYGLPEQGGWKGNDLSYRAYAIRSFAAACMFNPDWCASFDG